MPRPDLTRSDQKATKDIAARWTGLRREHVEGCAGKARASANGSNTPPGVVLVSIGEKRAPMVLEVIKRGFINHLVIDSQLEYALSMLI